jgi:hypothetical protein
VAEIRTHRGFRYRGIEDQEFGHRGFMKSRIPKSQKVHTVEISGKSPKGHFGISTTGRCRGESSELLTHEILKGSEPLDQGGSQSLIFLRRRRTGVSGFRYFGISDTRSTRGQGIVAPGFMKF